MTGVRENRTRQRPPAVRVNFPGIRGEEVISVTGLAKITKPGGCRWRLDGGEFPIAAGEFVAIMGPSAPVNPRNEYPSCLDLPTTGSYRLADGRSAAFLQEPAEIRN